MHHPGPPRFRSVGERVELAPRDPDPDATYEWRLVDAPAESDISVGGAPVVRIEPDEPGTYRFELDAPDGVHAQTVRAFPDERRPVRFEASVADFPLPPADVERVSAVGAFNEFRLGRDRPRREGDRYVLDVRLPPGEHGCGFAPNDDLSKGVDASVSVPGPGRPRLRLEATVDGEAVVVAADARAPPGVDATPDAKFHLDDRDALGAADVAVDGRELRVPLSALPDDGPARIHAVAVGERRSVADTVVLRRPRASATGEGAATASGRGARTPSSISVARPNDPPEWATDATVYQIFVRAFAGPEVTTTFREIERRVAYLRSLGIDCVWLTPVLASPTRHGYHVTDYFRLADDLGSREEFVSLVQTLRDAEIRVVFDLVINHSSRDHPAFQLQSAGVPRYADHYRRRPDGEDPGGVDWAGESAPEFYFDWERIPNLNYESLSVRRWMLDVVDEWAALVDGFRCDIAWGVPHGFWKEVRERTPAGFLLLDETIPRDARFHEGEFGAHYDTDLYETLRAIGRKEAPADELLGTFEDARRRGFPDGAAFLRYVENHDETRYLAACGEAALRAAAAATFTLPGLPTVYYGQERGMTDRRAPMRWHDGDSVERRSTSGRNAKRPGDGEASSDASGSRAAPDDRETRSVPADLTDYHRRLSRARERLPALRAGSEPEPVAHDAPSDGVTVYARETETPTGSEREGGASGRRLLVALNFDATPRTVALGEAAETRDLLTGGDVGVDDASADGATTVRVADAVVLRSRATE